MIKDFLKYTCDNIKCRKEIYTEYDKELKIRNWVIVKNIVIKDNYKFNDLTFCSINCFIEYLNEIEIPL